VQREQLLREARAASKLDQINIGTIHSIEEADDGQIFIAMACYEGETLKSRIQRGPIPAAEVKEIVVQIAKGLREAHSNSVVHRDIKPSNLMLTRQGVLKIIDFGLAKFLEPETQTVSGKLTGTAAYMSPEQALGKPADQRSDLWALGVVLYEMLTAGRLPFEGDTTPALLYAIVHRPPAPAGQLSGWWSAILDRTLSKDPARRYQSAAELLDAIEGRVVSALAETETLAFPGEAAATDPGKRSKRWWAATATVSALAAVGIGLYFRHDSGPLTEAGPKHLAVLHFVNVGTDPANRVTSDGLLETLTSRLSELDSSGKTLWVVPASEVRQRKVTEPGDAAKQLGVNFVVTGSVQQQENGVRLTVNLVDSRNLRQIGTAVISESDGNYSTLEDGAVGKLAELLRVEQQAAGSAQHTRTNAAAYVPPSMGPAREPREGYCPF
jgi:serine/threonine-protein kinase